VVALTATTASQQQTQPQQQEDSDGALIAAIIAAFLLFHTAGAITGRLRKPFARIGVGPAALKAGVGLVLSMPQQPMEGTGPATRFAVGQNELRRASFTLASVRRIQQAADEAKAQGEPVIPAIGQALKAEARWFSAHVAASQNRIAAAMAVDGMVNVYGNLLGWNAIKDGRCSPGCRNASGKNFRADQPPMIEGSPSLPGAVHPACRCFASGPHPGAPVISSHVWTGTGNGR
jgi:hypothetical protein